MLADVWRAPGATEPLAPLSDGAAGIGIMSLPGDPDGKVRRVPLLVGVGETLRPGLAVEAVRLSQHASTLILETNPQRLVIGTLRIAMPADGFLRLAPVSPDRQAARTISALDIVQDTDKHARLAGTITLIGGSAPALGGLRETPRDPLTPSVQIEANAVEQISAQRAPLPVSGGTQAMLGLVLAVIALVIAVTASPAFGVALAGVAIGAVWLGAIGVSLSLDRLIDPLTPSIGAAATFMTASIGSFVTVSRREARIRNRFAQHLAPEVVKRIAENPDMLKLRAEKREVTALFTDIEGFTSMTHRAGPEQLVAELDGYIEGVATIIMDHGGMVDKIVGDAVHALFNAPIDLADHAVRAVDCAIEVRSWTEQYRRARERPADRFRAHADRHRDGRGGGRRHRHPLQARLHRPWRCHQFGGAARGPEQGPRLVDLYRTGGRLALCAVKAAPARDSGTARARRADRGLRAMAGNDARWVARALCRRERGGGVRNRPGQRPCSTRSPPN